MDLTYNQDKSSNRLIGVMLLLLMVSLIFNEITSIYIKTDINGIHDSLNFIGSHYLVYLLNSINQIILLILYIAVAASFLIGLRNVNNTLAHFISFGIAAAGLTIMVAASGSLSLINITREFLISTGIETEIIAINGLSIAELRENALLIAYTIEGTGIFLIGLFIAITKYLKVVAAYSSIILAIILIIFCWLKFDTIIFVIVKSLVIANYLFISILFLRKSLSKN